MGVDQRVGPLLLLSACGPLFDPDDCRISGGVDCAPYRPEGLNCGAAHAGFTDEEVTLCDGRDPGSREGADLDESCPAGFHRTRIPDHEASSVVRSCAALSNAETSSGALAEVPAGAVCGWGSTQQGDSFETCMGLYPQQGRCPAGFSLKAALDGFADDGQRGAHIIAWCELDAGAGCTGADCPPPVTGTLCGMHGASAWTTWSAEALKWVPEGEPDPALLAALAEEGAAATVGACQGLDVALEGCPEGWVRSCMPDKAGSSDAGFTIFEGHCFCVWQG
ncbi:MAG: hypothetical protein RL071_4809 [Pseudomonadota bacterium]